MPSTADVDPFDPFRSTETPVDVRDLNAADFDPFWNNRTGDIRCPLCGAGAPEGHGISAANQRPWIRYSCGHTIAGPATPQ